MKGKFKEIKLSNDMYSDKVKHDWHELPLRYRFQIALLIIFGQPFTIFGKVNNNINKEV